MARTRRKSADRADRVAPDLEGEPGSGSRPASRAFCSKRSPAISAEQDVVAAGPQAGEQADHGLGAARPPAIGHEVQHGRAAGAGSCAAARRRPRADGRSRGCARSAPPRAPGPRGPAARPRRDRPARARSPPRGLDRFALDEQPGLPSATTSGMPPIRLATTGTPVAKAWSSACGTPSVRVEAWAKQSMVASRAGTSGRKPVKTTASESFASRASCSTQGRRIPSPTRRSVAPGRFSRTIAKACEELRMALRAAEHRDRADDRTAQAELAGGLRRAGAERKRLEVHAGRDRDDPLGRHADLHAPAAGWPRRS